MSLSLIQRLFRSTVVLLLLLVITGSGFQANDLQLHLNGLVVQRQFDFLTWTIPALAQKVLQVVSTPQHYLSIDERREAVREYFRLLGVVLELRDSIEIAYSDPTVNDPGRATQDEYDEADAIRDQLMGMQLLVEAVLQEQISDILSDEGYGVLGVLVPPVMFRVTQLPDQIIVSPRDRIEMVASAHLAPGLKLSERLKIEARVDKYLDVSSLVLPIAGLSTFPTMVHEATDIKHVVEVIAHEWVHLYLAIHPLGTHYDSNPDMRTMNETTASIVGHAIGSRVMERYFPELVPREVHDVLDREREVGVKKVFNFRHEMRETRIRSEELLAQGSIDQAERYMEERREFFVDHGYRIRKLNQAYFAFHGAYARQDGASGADPVGLAVLELWERSYSIRDFLDEMSELTSFSELLLILNGG